MAKRFNKNKWLYFALGIGAYYIISSGLSTILQPIILSYFSVTDTLGLTLIGFAPAILGILFCVILHKKLEQQWKATSTISESDILDDSFSSEEIQDKK